MLDNTKLLFILPAPGTDLTLIVPIGRGPGPAKLHKIVILVLQAFPASTGTRMTGTMIHTSSLGQ